MDPTDVADERPLPVVDLDSAPFWAAAREGRLEVQRCDRCERWIYYPRALCPHCHAGDLTWRESAGLGTIYSYTVARRPAGPAFKPYAPYVVALVDLDEGFRMLSTIATPDPGHVAIGARVRVAFERRSEEIAVPVFVLLDAGS